MPILTKFEDACQLKARDKVLCECEICHKTFTQQQHVVIRIGYKRPESQALYNNKRTFCSKECLTTFNDKRIDTYCEQCNKPFKKCRAYYLESKHHFCGQSCAAKYHNTHKTTGFRRSKLEIYLEKELPKIYPNIQFIFNDRKELGYELDIYLPELKLAFELNGIFHYEPIFGQKKLDSTKFNDKQKFGLCQQKLISLCVIDTTSLKYFKGEKAKKFLDIIIKIIDEKIGSGG